MNDDEIRAQINELIRDELQENINEYVDAQDETKKTGLGFVGKEGEDQLKVNIPNVEVDKYLKSIRILRRIRSLILPRSRNLV